MKKLLIALAAMAVMAVPARADEAELLARIEALEQRVAQLETLIVGGKSITEYEAETDGQETDVIILGPGTWIVGEDLQAGKYNVTCNTGSGEMTIYKSYEDMRAEKYSYIETYMMGSHSYIEKVIEDMGEELARNMLAEKANNVHLEDGYCIFVGAPEIALTLVE